jgi:hypothetical protein
MNKFQKRIADRLAEAKCKHDCDAVDLELRARKAKNRLDARLAFLAHKANLPSDYKRLKTMNG